MKNFSKYTIKILGFSILQNEELKNEDIIGSYFQPTTRRARQLLGQSAQLDTASIINTWRGNFFGLKTEMDQLKTE